MVSSAAPARKFIPQIATAAFLLLLILSTLIYFAFEARRVDSIDNIKGEQLALLAKDNELIAVELRETIAALKALHERTNLLGKPSKEALRTVIFANPAAFQARWLSLEGQELIRFDRTPQGIVEISNDRLQDKSGRDYFTAMTSLRGGELYVSQFNLNIESGKIEVPFKPTVRIGIKAEQGYLIANLNLSHLFALVRTPSYSPNPTWLINREGDWLIAPQPRLEWGFLLGQRYTIFDYFSFDNLVDIVSSESWAANNTDTNDILLALPLNLGPTYQVAGQLEENLPVVVRFISSDAVAAEIESHYLMPPGFAYLLALLFSILIYFLLLLWRNKTVDEASALVARDELDRLVGIANLLPQMTWTTNEQGQCDFVNSRWESYTGMVQAELEGMGWFDFIHPEDQASVEQAWQYALKSGQDFAANFRIRNESGSYRMFDTRAHALKDNRGKVIKWFGSNTDVQVAMDLAERVQNEKSILETNLSELLQEKRDLLRRFEFAADSANLGVWELDLSRHHLVWDEKMFAIYGQQRSLKHNIYRVWKSCIHPEDIDQVESSLAQASQSDKSVHLEYRVRRSDGQVIWIRDDAAVERSQDGANVRLIGCSLDITSTKTLTLSLQEALAHLEQARKVAGIGLFRITNSNSNSEWSDEVFSLLGLDKQTSFSLERLLHYCVPEQRATVEDEYRQAIANRKTYDTYIKVQTPNNEQRFLHLYLEAIGADESDEPIIYGVLLDVSEQKEVELDLIEARSSAESSNRAKSAFLANISHEIRTPMNGILGMLSLLRARTENDENANLLDKAFHGAERLMSILNDVLDISRADAGKLTLRCAQTEIDKLLQESVDIFSSNAELNGVSLVIEVSPQLPLSILTDGLRLGQIISNLVGNAVKFTERGGQITVTLELEYLLQTTVLKVTVSDTGIGMSEDQLGRVFDEFNQADESMSKRYGGTGLGLSICKRLVKLMSGDISLDSELGVGTTVRLWIPFDFVEAQSTRAGLTAAVHIDLVTLKPKQEVELRPYLTSGGRSLAVHQTFDTLFEQTALGVPNHQYLFVDSSLIDGPEGDHFCEAFERAKSKLRLYEAVFISLPNCVTTALRVRLSSESTHLIHAGITAVQIEQLLQKGEVKTQAAVANQVSSEKNRKMGELRIISVDDVALNNEVVRGLLGNLDAEVELFGDARSAIERVKSGGVDLVLMDVHMPQMNGLEATTAIRQLELENQPLIFGLSASVLPEDRAKGIEAGMDNYLNKPFRINELLDLLDLEPNAKYEESTATSSEPTGDYPWPDFMDLNSALAQTSGDEAALVNLCGAFANGFRSFSAEYTEAVTDQNALKLETLTHKVKGASRYIGDIEVHELAQRLEAEVRAGTLPKTKELGDLVALRIEVLTPLIRQRSSAQDYATPQSEIKKLTSEFLAAYSDNCFIPPNEWKPYIAGLKTTGMIETAEQLQSAIEANAFEEAAAVLTEIKAGLE